MRRTLVSLGISILAALAWTGCGDDSETGLDCGAGTVEVDGECVVPPPGAGVPVVSTSTLDFGAVDCGSVAFPRAFVIGNEGGESFSFSIELGAGAGSPYVVVPDTGVVGPLGQVTVEVFTQPIPATSEVTPDLYGDTLTVTTDVAGDAPHEVALQQTASGVILDASTAVVDFPAIRQVGSAALTSQVTIENLGNVPTTVSLVSTHDAFTVATGATAIAAGDSASFTIEYVPFALGALAGELLVEATGTPCAAPPAIATSGTGTFAGTAESALLVGPPRQRSASGTLCVLLASGHVACMGSNVSGSRGAGIGVSPPALIPNVVRTADGAPLDDVVELAGGRAHVCARRADGTAYCWGNTLSERSRDNPVGQPFATQSATGVIGLAANYGFVCFVTAPDGELSCTGQAPQRWGVVDPGAWTVTGATAAALNGGGGYALLGDGTVLSFGSSRNGARGNGDPDNAPPSPVANVANAVAVTAAVKRDNRIGGGCAVLADGTASCWGDGRHGMNADGTENSVFDAVQVQTAAAAPLTGITAISSGRDHRCAIAAGGVHCWGRGSEGQLGRVTGQNNTFAALTEPPITNAVTIASAGRGSCAVLDTRGVRCWGRTPVSSGATPTALAAFEPLP